MSKGKQAKFADMRQNPLVVECPFGQLRAEGFALRGKWHTDFFHNPRPITLELGCGHGEYTVELAHRYPQRNFIGVDIKGARMWQGAQRALREALPNAGFLRTQIELLPSMFAADEVDELWLTFSDPQQKNPRKRLTGTSFLARYRQFLVDGGIVHVKTDSNFLYTYTRLMAERNGLPVEVQTDDLYGAEGMDAALTEIQTHYERMWLEQGIPIKYLRFRLPREGALIEPDVEIPVDGYRSYRHEVRSPRLTAK